MNKLENSILAAVLACVLFLSGAAAGGKYVLKHIEISHNDTRYIVNYEGHLFEYKMED